MKYSVHAGLWMAQWTDEITSILKTVADLGSLLGMSDEKAAALGKSVREFGLEVTCSDGLSAQKDITSEDPAIREAGIEYLKWAIRTTALIGSRGLAGVLYAPWGVYDPENKAVRAERSAAAFAAVEQELEASDVTLGLEAINRFETDLVNTSAEAVAMAKASGSKRVGVLLDTFHLNIEEKDISGAITSAADKLVHFHVSDNDRGVPGSGHIPWNIVKNALNEIGYDGWIVAEMFVIAGNPASKDLNIWGNIEPEATKAAEQALSFMRGQFG